jgi:hypothetical protein
VVICGFDPDKDEFLLHDPAVSVPQQRLLRVSSASLDHARRAVGTDHDLLFVEISPTLAFLQCRGLLQRSIAVCG